MPTVVAGNTVAVTVPKGSTITMSGQGTHQTSPPGSNGLAVKQLTTINTQPQVFGPFVADVTLNIMAAPGTPGVVYSLASSNPSKDTTTQSPVIVSRNLVQSDNGTVIPVATGLTMTLPAGLVNFSVILLPQLGASITLAFGAGVTGNGAATSIVRTRTNNAVGFSILAEAQDTYAVGGT